MNILVSPLAFKGTLSPIEAADAIEKGIKKAFAGANIAKIPIADGGDGSLDIFLNEKKGQKIQIEVQDALGNPQITHYGILEDKSAVIEIASICGLSQIPIGLRNPSHTTSYGVGEAIRHALDRGVQRFIACLGGSATNDGGAGMLQALGAHLFDSSGNELTVGGASLRHLHRIDLSELDQRLRKASFVAACDVNNPLLGQNGATAVYAPQKGATEEMVVELEQALQNYADVIRRDFQINVDSLPYTGAAGGIAAALHVFLGAELKSGTQFILNTLKIEKDVKMADLVITGEGRLDDQTHYEKGILGLAQLTSRYKVSLLAIVGTFEGEFASLQEKGIGAVIPLSFMPLKSGQEPSNASELVSRAAEQAIRCIAMATKF